MLTNVCLLVTGGYLLGLTYQHWPLRSRWQLEALRLGLGALTSLLMALNGVEVGAFQLDLRYVVLAVVAARYGVGLGLLMSLPALVCDFLGGPAQGGVALANCLSVTLLVQLVRFKFDFEKVDWRDLRLLPVPFFGVGLAVLATPEGHAAFGVAYLPMLLLNSAGSLLAMGVVSSRLHMLRATHRLRMEAMTDTLTGLGNHRRFDRDLLSLPVGAPLVLLDVDHFRRLVELHGTAESERMLRRLGQLLAEAAPGRAYRLNSKEFALLLAGSGEVTAFSLTEGLLARVAAPSALPWATVTMSAGMAVRQPQEQPSALLHRADEALYLAKTNGRNRVVLAPVPAPGGTDRPARPEPPVQPRYSLWQAQRTTVELLTQRRTLTRADWQELLEGAVASVDGAEAGSLTVREGRDFRLFAQCGFGPEIVGTYLTEGATMQWYGGDVAGWRQGVPRVLRGSEVLDAFGKADPFYLQDEAQRFRELGGSATILSTLCVPVVLQGEVVAHLNLDSFTSETTFTDRVMEDSKVFAQQLAALLQLQERWQELDLLGQLHNELGADDQEVEGRLTALAVKLLRSSHATLLRYDAPRDVLEATVVRGSDVPTPRLILPRGGGPAWRSLLEADVVRVADLRIEPGSFVPPELGDADAALMAVPLLSRVKQPLGVLALTRSVHRPFQASDAHLASILSSVGSRVLERQSHLSDLRATLEAALTTLGVALEARDFETQGHTQRVSDLACRMGVALGLPEDRLTALRHGAALHDIGKLCIPDSVLLKPGRLSPEEYETVKRHSALGAELARRIPYLHPEAHGVVRHHHERWDGTGYPDRLAGEDIPLLARLFALCDVYDALTSERPYKEAMAPAVALEIIQGGLGTQFDPELTTLFVQLHPGDPDPHLVAPDAPGPSANPSS